MSQRAEEHKNGPIGLAAQSGEKNVDSGEHSPHAPNIQADNYSICKLQRRQHTAPLSIWPKPDHPFFRQLRLDRDFVWRRMMSSVCPGGID